VQDGWINLNAVWDTDSLGSEEPLLNEGKVWSILFTAVSIFRIYFG